MIEGKIDLSTKEILRLSWPVFISLIAQNLIGVIDTAFVSRVGEVELGGTAMGSLVYFSIYTVGWGLASGTQIMISHRYGAKKFNQIGTKGRGKKGKWKAEATISPIVYSTISHILAT